MKTLSNYSLKINLMKKKSLFTLILILVGFTIQAQNKSFLITGASFAIPQNGWFEIMCQSFDATPINKAVGGDSICSAANSMAANKLYTLEELDNTDAFIIFHAHEENVADESVLKEDYNEYQFPTKNYSIAFDYVIRKYIDDCKNLEFNPTSKYYNQAGGKPAVIVLASNWHDARPLFNGSIRKLAEKWQLPLIEWDKNIGFSNEGTVGGVHPSVQYSMDTKTSNGITYGWHPRRGSAEYIQLKMAEIAVSTLETIFGQVQTSVTVNNKSRIITDGEKSYVSFSFRGKAPWNLTYEVNGKPTSVNNITLTNNPLFVPIPASSATQDIVVKATHVSNEMTQNGLLGDAITIKKTNEAITPIMDTYAHERNTTISNATSNTLQVKTYTDRYSRESFLTFDISNINPLNKQIIFRTYFYKIDYTKKELAFQDVHSIELSGNTTGYADITWESRPSNLEAIATESVYVNELNSYINWDITDWIQEKKAEGATEVTFCIKAVKGIDLLSFYSSNYSKLHPQILLVANNPSSISEIEENEKINIYPNPIVDKLHIEATSPIDFLQIFSSTGQKVYEMSNPESDVDVSSLSSGIYIAYFNVKGKAYSQKIIKK